MGTIIVITIILAAFWNKDFVDAKIASIQEEARSKRLANDRMDLENERFQIENDKLKNE